MDSIINTKILSHPANWLIIFVIGMFWLWGLELLNAYFTGRHPATTA